MQNQIMIAQIKNGWLVSVPSPIQQGQLITTYCSSYEDVCDAIKPMFPVSAAPRASAVVAEG